MTERELYAIYCKDSDMIGRFATAKAKTMFHWLRKGFGQHKTHCYDYKTRQGTEYKLLITVNRGQSGSYYCEPFVYCKETNDYYPATTLQHEGEYDAEHYTYTTHFLHRYAERALGVPDMPVNKILVRIQSDVVYAVTVYQNGDNRVQAIPNGIILQRHDNKRGIYACKTFVSVDMMRSSQIKAFSVVADLLRKYTAQFHNKVDESIILRSFEKDFIDNGVMGPDIFRMYGEYFKKNNINKQ